MKENFDAYVPHDSRRYFISDDFRSLCLRCYTYISMEEVGEGKGAHS